MKRAEILEAARVCVCGEREQEYGTPEDSFSIIADLWGAYTGVEFSAKDVAMMMALLKIARIKRGDKADSFVDLAGYAACAGEIAREGTTHEEKKRNGIQRSDKPRMCDPGMCSCCQYIGDGDFICDRNSSDPVGVLVVENWAPTKDYMQCRGGPKKYPTDKRNKHEK